MSDLSLIPTEHDPHPLLKLKGKEKTQYAITSFLITVFLTITLYVFPDFSVLEYATTRGVYFVLYIFGYSPRMFMYELGLNELGFFDSLIYSIYDGKRSTFPSISIDGTTQNNFIIVRACTGMQAGALLIGLIASTPAEMKTKIKTGYIVLFTLFIGNIFRIAAQIALTTLFIEVFHLDFETVWAYSHDWTGRPIGFLATIGFTLYIEKSGIRILDTITIWMDELLSIGNYFLGGNKG